MIARRRDVPALEDATVQLRRGFGVEVVEVRGDRAHTSEGHWFRAQRVRGRAPIRRTGAGRAPVARDASHRGRSDGALGRRRSRGAARDRVRRRSTGPRDEDVDRRRRRGRAVFDPTRQSTVSTRSYRRATRERILSCLSAPPSRTRIASTACQTFNTSTQHIALHGAYWHRRFGERVSHGCVNLAPTDAAWLYEFTPNFERGKSGAVVRVR